MNQPLGIKWFREKKFENYRMYYLIYEDVKSIFIINISKKKDQQKIIDSINLLISDYKKEIEKIIKKKF